MTGRRKCPHCVTIVPAEASVCATCRGKLPSVNEHWWRASDGLLYPPQSHPDFLARAAQPRPPMSTRNKVWIGVAALAGVGILVAAMAAPTPQDDDVLGEEACEELLDLRDIGLYTNAELREQVQQIWDDARYAKSSRIRYDAREMLSAVTVGDMPRFADAATDMAEACDGL